MIPRAWAAFRFMTSSNFMGRSTGRSAGGADGGQNHTTIASLDRICPHRHLTPLSLAGDAQGLVASITNMPSWFRSIVPALKTSIGLSAPWPVMDWPPSTWLTPRHCAIGRMQRFSAYAAIRRPMSVPSLSALRK